MAGSLVRRRALRWAAMASVLAIAFSACSSTSSTSPTTPAGPSGTPGGATVPPTSNVDTSELVILTSGLGSQQWAPAETDSGVAPIKNAIGETLIRENRETREYEPGLALEWTQSTDGLTLDIKLRPDIPFQEGWGTMTADDVKFSIVQYLGPSSDVGNQAQAMMEALGNDPEANVEVVGPLELKLHSPKFTVGLIPALADGSTANAMYIQSKKYWTEKPDEALQHPIGTGPYKFVSSTPGTEVKLTAVDTHWRQTPTFKNVTFRVIPDDAARLAQVESGAADMAVIPGNLVREAQTKPTIKILGAADYAQAEVELGGQYPGYPYDDPTAPWIQRTNPDKGLAIRQAMSLAIDRQAILDAVLAGQATLTTGPITQYPKIPDRNLPGWTVPAYDPDQAKTKLAEGGYPDGFEITMQEFENRPGSGQADIAEAVAGMWEAIGLKVTRLQLTDEQSDSYVDKPPKTQGAAWIRLDPFYDNPVQNYQCCYNVDAGHQEMYDPLFDETLAKLQAEPDPVKRAALNNAVIQKMIDNMSIIPMFTLNWSVAAGPKVGSWVNLTGEGNINSIESITP
jgi:peptide/nickel transport system substrate-binding protein